MAMVADFQQWLEWTTRAAAWLPWSFFLGDKQILWQSGVMKPGDPAKPSM
jgi:hypothetical protein